MFASKRKWSGYSKKGGGKRQKTSLTSFRKKGARSSLIGRIPYWHKVSYVSKPPKGLSPFPDRLNCDLKYTINVSLAHTSGAVGTLTIVGNDLLDPSLAIGSTQPYYFDQLMTLYYKFIVNASTCKISELAITSAIAMEQALSATPDSTVYTTVRIAKQAPFSRVGFTQQSNTVMPLPVRPASEGFQIVSSYGTNKVFGMPKYWNIHEFDQYGDTGTSPSPLWYWQYISQPIDGASTASTVVTCEMIYHCTFCDLFVPAV